jgi:hypothetical protein
VRGVQMIKVMGGRSDSSQSYLQLVKTFDSEFQNGSNAIESG